MSSIGDSSSVLVPGKMLPQHQTAINLIVGQLDSPQVSDFAWFDLCCGKGQILHQLKDNISAKNIAKINFRAYDINNDDIRINEQLGRVTGFKSYDSKVGEISDFKRLVSVDEKKDFITCINSFHEIDPFLIPEIFIESLLRLKPNGILFVYDMEELVEYELGAVTWSRNEIYEIVSALLTRLNGTEYLPEPQGWIHQKTTGWSIQIHRGNIVSDLQIIEEQKNAILNDMKALVLQILERKRNFSVEALNSLTAQDSDTKEEQGLQVKYLYDYWAVNRILLKHQA